MALFRKFFYRKPPDGLLEITERVYVFDSCFCTDVLDDDVYKVHVRQIATQLHEQFSNSSFLVFNFREGERKSQLADILYDMTVMDYPRQYEGCPILSLQMIHHFIRSSDSWISLEGHQNVVLLHCERGGWPTLAFMLAGFLIYQKLYTGEQKTLDLLHREAPKGLLPLLTPLNPMPSQIRYLQYITRRNISSEWPPPDQALVLDCIILRVVPSFDTKGGCRPILRVYGLDPQDKGDRTTRMLFNMVKKSKSVRYLRQTDCSVVKIDIQCGVQGDVVLECIHVNSDLDREEMMFRVMFNTAFIRSNILILGKDDIDVMWDAKGRYSKDFRAEVLFTDVDTSPKVKVPTLGGQEKDRLPMEAFAKVQELFKNVDWTDGKGEAARHFLQQISSADGSLESGRNELNAKASKPDKEGNEGQEGQEPLRFDGEKQLAEEMSNPVQAPSPPSPPSDTKSNAPLPTSPPARVQAAPPSSLSPSPSPPPDTKAPPAGPPPPPPGAAGPPAPPPLPSAKGPPAPPPPPGAKVPAPPVPPPPPGAAGPPAPPPLPGAKGPPAPPPPPGAKVPGPPPPPGGRGPGPSPPAPLLSNPRSTPGTTAAAARRASLKAFHWVKVARAVQGSLWAEIQKLADIARGPEIDTLELASLFPAAVAAGPGEGRAERRASLGAKPQKVHLIDMQRAKNCEIMLTKVKMPLPDVASAILALDGSILDVDQVGNLLKFCPTKEEMDTIKGYTGDKENLGKCEQFFLEMMKVPRMESKLRVFLFKLQFAIQVGDLRKTLNIVNNASKEVRESLKLRQVMQTILSIGNALNQGTARGSAIGFKLDSLLKLNDMRAKNNKMTLMHYLDKVLSDKLPDTLDFHKDLAHLEEASKVQLKFLAEEMQAVTKSLEKVEQEITESENDGSLSEGFHKNLKSFLKIAEADMRSLMLLYSEVGRNADGLAQYFGEDPARCPFEQVVSVLLNFVVMFKRAHDENSKISEIERKKAEKEAEQEKLKHSPSKKNSNVIRTKAEREAEQEKFKHSPSKKESDVMTRDAEGGLAFKSSKVAKALSSLM